MPPTSSVRKSSLATNSNNTPTDPTALATTTTRRTTSGRTIRPNTTRPTNYYARPFGSLSYAAGAVEQDGPSDAAATTPPGFFPALQYFSDAVTALPREVMRQFTLMKEVEAKIHGPNEQLGEMVDALMEVPVPARKGVHGQNEGGTQQQQGLMMSLTANNSLMGSASASLVNGVAGRLSAQASVTGSVNGEDVMMQQQVEGEEDLERRRRYHELRMLTHSLLPNLDEKNVVLAEANRVLALQLARVESVMPHVEDEISEESRLGSMTHWAYSDNRQKKVAAAPAAALSRRDVAATNSLAAAANAIHETEIAQARREAGREATRERYKGRAKEHVDSDFDDKPKKAQARLGKGRAALQAAVTGLGITTSGEPVKRRKVDRGPATSAMERTLSGTTKGAKAQRETPRSTPAVEQVAKTKKTKPAPAPPKKRMPGSAQASPALASSPLNASFAFGTVREPPSSARPQSARLRKNSSTTTNLRHEQLVGDEGSQTPSIPTGKVNGNGEKTNGKRKAPADKAEEAEDPAAAEGDKVDNNSTKEAVATSPKREDVEMPDAVPSRSASNSNSGKASRASKPGTPRTENFPATDGPAMARTRSTRSMRATSGRESSSSEPQVQGGRGKHKRNVSSHLVKQLAPFNRSPDSNRHRSEGEEDDDDDDEEGGDEDVDADMGEDVPERVDATTVREEGVGGAGERDDEDEAKGNQQLPQSRPSRKSASRTTSRPDTQPAGPIPTPAQETSSPSPPAPAPPAEIEPPEPEEAEAEEPAILEQTAVEPEPEPEPEEKLEDAEDEQNVEEEQVQHHPVPDLEADEEAEGGGGEEGGEGEMEDDGDESEHDPDDPNEPKYCYCNRGSYGEMVACDNERCRREWFHLGCTELREAPGEEEVWYCRECRPAISRKRGGKGKVGGR